MSGPNFHPYGGDSTIGLTGISIPDNKFTIVGSSDTTNTLKFEVDAESANADLTIDTGAQTVDRTLTIPVLTGNRTLSVIDQAQTITGANIFTGGLTSGDGTTSYSIAINGVGSPSSNRDLNFQSAGTTVWNFRVSGNQTGSDAGSSLSLTARTDAGATIDNPISIVRAAGGAITFARPTTQATNWSQTGATTFSTGTGTFTHNGAITIADAKDITLNATTGTKIGTATSEKIGFWNATPVIQQASAAQAAVATTGSTNSSPYGFTTAAQADAIVTLVNQLRADLVTLGLIKGAA